MLVEEDYVGESGGFGRGEQIREDKVTTIQAYGSREEESDFFAECCEAGGGAAGGCDKRAGISETGQKTVFIVDALPRFFGLLIEGLIVFVVFP